MTQLVTETALLGTTASGASAADAVRHPEASAATYSVPAASNLPAAADSRGASPELSLRLGGEGANSPSGASRAAHIRASYPVARPTHHRTHQHQHHDIAREIGPAGDGATDAGRALTPRDGASRDSEFHETAAMFAVFLFLGFIGAAIGIAMLAAFMIVDWVGVAEVAFRLFDFG